MYAYKITNLVNEKIYIGITTTSMGNRISSYKSAPNKGRKKIIDQFGKIRYVKVA